MNHSEQEDLLLYLYSETSPELPISFRSFAGNSSISYSTFEEIKQVFTELDTIELISPDIKTLNKVYEHSAAVRKELLGHNCCQN